MSSYAIAICCLLVVTAYCCFCNPTSSSQQNRFTVDFFKHAYDAHKNAILAPIAIRSGLAMMDHVATPEAGRILRSGLYLPDSGSEVIKETKAAVRRINERKDSLEMLSKVYLQNETLNPELVPHFRDNYGTDSEIVDFFDKSRVVDRVNTWVNASSRGMIPEFLQADELSVNGTSLLINVMVMKATWQYFDEKKTKKQTFHFLNGNREVDMMKVRGQLPHMYFKGLRTLAIKLLYAPETDLSMIILLPDMKVTLQDVIKQFTIDYYNLLARLVYEDEDVYEYLPLGVPRFKIKQQLDARPALKKMGFESLFNQEEFQVLACQLSMLGLVKQSAFIKVDEKGTEAAAAAALGTERIFGARNVDVDRPFMFIIRKESTKDILFIGHYSNYEE